MLKSFKSYLIATLAIFVLLQSVVCFADFPSGFFPTLTSGDLYYGQDMSVSSADIQQKIMRSVANDEARLASTMTQTEPYYVLIENETITVVYDIGSKSELFGVVMSRCGANNIFDYSEFFTVNKVDKLDRTLISQKNFRRTSVTDTHSPYVVQALYNIDGDRPASFAFTGGNHSYDEAYNKGNRTGSTQSISFMVDGAEVQYYDGYATRVDIIYENHVQASNTAKMFTEGRNVIREMDHIVFDGEKWKSSINVVAFEPVEIYRYYGLQFDTREFGDKVMYVYNDGRISLYDAKDASVSTDKTCNIINVFGDKFDVEISITSDFGTNNDTDHSAFNENYKKTYFNIVNTTYNSLHLEQGSGFNLEGYYKFTSSK